MIEASGSYQLLHQAIRCAMPAGRVATVAPYHGDHHGLALDLRGGVARRVVPLARLRSDGMSYRVARRILNQYERWATERGLVPDGEADRRRDRIGILIHGRADYLRKPDPTHWRSGDVHELLMQHCAARQADAWDLAMYGPTEVRDFLRFLDETERLHPGSTRVSTLLKELDRLTPKFAAAMADKSQWRLAKRVFTAMSADGVDPADQFAADLWAEKFSALDAEARRDVLGEMIDDDPRLGTGLMIVHEGQVAILTSGQVPCKHQVWPDARCSCGECVGLDALPAITLPGKDELAEAVTGYGCGLLRRLSRVRRLDRRPGSARRQAR